MLWLIVQPDVDQSNLDWEGAPAAEHSGEKHPPNNNNPNIILVKRLIRCNICPAR